MELNRRSRVALLVLAGACVLLVPADAFASAGIPQVGVGPIDAVAQAVVNASRGWIPTLQNYARGCFLGLAAISLAWIGISHALSGSTDLKSAIGAMVLEVIALGFFGILISEGPGWAADIVTSLQQAGREAAGGNGDTPQLILDQMAELGVKVIEDLSLLNSITSGLAMAIATLGVLGLTALMCGLTLVGWVQAWVVIGAGTILLGLGGSPWTRPIATNYLRHALAAGVKLMVLELMSGIFLAHVKAWVVEANVGSTFSLELLVHILLSLVVMTIMLFSVPSYASSVVTGAVTNGGEAALTRAVATAAMIGAGLGMRGAAAKAAPAGSSLGSATGLSPASARGLVPQTSAPGLVGGGASPVQGTGLSSSSPAVRPSPLQARVSLGGNPGAENPSGPGLEQGVGTTTPAPSAVARAGGEGGDGRSPEAQGSQAHGSNGRRSANGGERGRPGASGAEVGGKPLSPNGGGSTGAAREARVGAGEDQGVGGGPREVPSGAGMPAPAAVKPALSAAPSAGNFNGSASAQSSFAVGSSGSGSKSAAAPSVSPGLARGVSLEGSGADGVGPKAVPPRGPLAPPGAAGRPRASGGESGFASSLGSGAQDRGPAPHPAAPGQSQPGSAPRHSGATRLERAMSGGEEDSADE